MFPAMLGNVLRNVDGALKILNQFLKASGYQGPAIKSHDFRKVVATWGTNHPDPAISKDFHSLMNHSKGVVKKYCKAGDPHFRTQRPKIYRIGPLFGLRNFFKFLMYLGKPPIPNLT